MTRRRVKLAKTMNASSRKASCKKRRAGLFKKAEELCVLCDVQIGIVVHCPEEAAAALSMWPSQPEAEGMMARFLAMPESERAKKSSTVESYLKERLEREEERIYKAKKMNDEKEMDEMLWHLVEGNMDAGRLVNRPQISGLYFLAADMIDKIQQIGISSQQNPAEHPSAPSPPPPPPPQVAPEPEKTLTIPASMEHLMNDQWFMDTMTHHQEILPIGGLRTTGGYDLGLGPEYAAAGTSGPSTTGGDDWGLGPEYTAAGTSGAKDNELPDDLNSAWPHIYSP